MTQDTDSDSDRLDLPDVAFPKWTSVAKLIVGLLLGYILYEAGVGILTAVVTEVLKAGARAPTFSTSIPDDAIALVWKLAVLVAALTYTGVLFHSREQGHRFRALDMAVIGGSVALIVLVNAVGSLELLMFGLGGGLDVLDLLGDLLEMPYLLKGIVLSAAAVVVAYAGQLSTRSDVWTTMRSFWIFGGQLGLLDKLEFAIENFARGEVMDAFEYVLSGIVSGGFEGLAVLAMTAILLRLMDHFYERAMRREPTPAIDVSPE